MKAAVLSSNNTSYNNYYYNNYSNNSYNNYYNNSYNNYYNNSYNDDNYTNTNCNRNNPLYVIKQANTTHIYQVYVHLTYSCRSKYMLTVQLDIRPNKQTNKRSVCISVDTVLYTNIDQTLVNSLHGLLNCEIGGLDCRGITTEYRTGVHCIHMYHLFCKCVGPCYLFGSVWSMFIYNNVRRPDMLC